ncbi:hypothetical protein VQ042_05495 [Aurantimonas sp. A2-1-M11]|uniref:hypothetical protein n=1 Tax=Aurantimonas sp. A2-1-M11 TaxID=3113712 RepID=UPI002F94A646
MSDPNEHPQSEVVAIDQEPGGDADQPGIAQPISRDEIDDLINNSQMPIEEREARLHEIAQRLGTRENIDLGDEFDPMREQVNEALNMLASGGHSYGTLDSTGFDPDDRSDSQPADDTGPSKV